MIDQVKKYLLALQSDICTQLEQVDGKASFIKDNWKKEGGAGGGLTRVLTDGAVFEQAGVTFPLCVAIICRLQPRHLGLN